MRPLRVLDLFCGAGLVARGFQRCGVEFTGVDLSPQPRYPGPFWRHDALSVDERTLDDFPIIWASPPCLKDTVMKHAPGAKGDAHPDLITPTRAMLQRWAARTGGQYIIENVEAAALIDPVILCGSMFDLGVSDEGVEWRLRRHRKFETNWPLRAPQACRHGGPVVGVFGGHARKRAASAGGRGTREGWSKPHPEIMASAFGLRRDERVGLTATEISQGVPPIYAEHVVNALMAHLQASTPLFAEAVAA